MLKKHNIYDANYNSYYGHLDKNCVAVITNDHILTKVRPSKMYNCISETKAIVDADKRLQKHPQKSSKRGGFEQYR